MCTVRYIVRRVTRLPAFPRVIDGELAAPTRIADPDQARESSPTPIDRSGWSLWSLALSCLIATAVLATMAFRSGQTGVGLVLASFVAIAVPLLGFATVRLALPLWRARQAFFSRFSGGRGKRDRPDDVLLENAKRRGGVWWAAMGSAGFVALFAAGVIAGLLTGS